MHLEGTKASEYRRGSCARKSRNQKSAQKARLGRGLDLNILPNGSLKTNHAIIFTEKSIIPVFFVIIPPSSLQFEVKWEWAHILAKCILEFENVTFQKLKCFMVLYTSVLRILYLKR